MIDEDRHDELLMLYQHPTFKGFPSHPNRIASRKSATCQDYLQMGLWLADDVITEARFQGQGCVICEVTASLTVEMIRGRHISDLCEIHAPDILALLGFSLSPAKQECALLSWYLIRSLVAWERLERL